MFHHSSTVYGMNILRKTPFSLEHPVYQSLGNCGQNLASHSFPLSNVKQTQTNKSNGITALRYHTHPIIKKLQK